MKGTRTVNVPSLPGRSSWIPAAAALALFAYGGVAVRDPGNVDDGRAGTVASTRAAQAKEPARPDDRDDRVHRRVRESRTYRGHASWYGRSFQGSPTASGELFDMHALTAAHRTLPLGSYARVRNLDNGRSVVVRINDRGPHARRRTIDLSYAAARKIAMVSRGTAPVEVRPLSY